MRLFVTTGLGGIARLVAAAVVLVYLFVAALGTGIPQLADLLGIKLSASQNVAGAALLLGALLVWDNAVLRRKLTEHSTSPRLTWSDPKVELFANGAIHLEVWCENTGPTESVAILRGGRAWSGASEWTMPVAPGSPINSSKIDQQKHRWRVEIDSPANVQFSMGTHEITWMLIYFDNARPNTHGYLTQVGLTVSFDAYGVGTYRSSVHLLDSTSTNEERHKRYLRYVNEARRAKSK